MDSACPEEHATEIWSDSDYSTKVESSTLTGYEMACVLGLWSGRYKGPRWDLFFFFVISLNRCVSGLGFVCRKFCTRCHIGTSVVGALCSQSEHGRGIMTFRMLSVLLRKSPILVSCCWSCFSCRRKMSCLPSKKWSSSQVRKATRLTLPLLFLTLAEA